MVSICPLISKSSSLFTNPLEIVPSAPITIGITVTEQGLDIHPSFRFLVIYSVICRDGNVHYLTSCAYFILFFIFIFIDLFIYFLDYH